jgi:hypothetical protein
VKVTKGSLIAVCATVLFAMFAVLSSGWQTAWWAFLAVGGIMETVALMRRDKGDTLSESVWAKSDDPKIRAAVLVFMAWVAWHFTWGRRKT